MASPDRTSADLMRKDLPSVHGTTNGADREVISVPSCDPVLPFGKVWETLGPRTPGDRSDVLVCDDDARAFGAIDPLRREGGPGSPEDIVATGFDDVPQAVSRNQGRTPSRQPPESVAQKPVNVRDNRGRESSGAGVLGKIAGRASG